ncbi:DUF885 domain-containing protein [Hephaestia mangrovi]|uniref:DUF885 domain-containing protein n=1 Tax=Hephaestia mangrovi TaxID=2873268 RepID=UPI001CA62726|nr:DUF885 domain-containing protein [Hephaestia mangrovi]MBY8828890.1 DUF885 domain-containing protein [Hephaestia mangrovi]
MFKPAHYASLLAVLAASASANASRDLQSPTQQLDALANRFVDQDLAHDPTLAYEAGLATTVHDRFEDRTPAAIASFAREEREDLQALLKLDASTLPPAAMPTYARLREKLESDLQLRVCKRELWNVNHFDGWQSTFADVADAQPIDTPDQRAQALRRWASLPTYVDVEIANLKRGLDQGYTAPKSVVRRVIRQMNGLATGVPEKSPFFSPAARSNDAEFKAAFRQLIVERIDPALKRYGQFLKLTYLPRARVGVAISDLPNGPACYRAFLRAETTLNRSPGEVFALGQQTVAANSAKVLRLGRELYGTSDIPTTLSRVKAAPGEHFKSRDELLAFSRHFLARAKSKTAASLIGQLPKQDVVVEPERAFEEAAGVSSHLDIQPDTTKPAIYRIELGNWASETRAEAEIVVAHESLPGHHLQIAFAREISPATRLSKLISNAAYQEGWARYAEGMAEEAGIYDTPNAAILRRIWPARGMVVDPGLHTFHWTRAQAIKYLMSTGRFTRKSADAEVDRIAVMPGQLTAYDSGALVIFALRDEAERQLGKRFDLKAFNQVVLEEGVVPLNELRRHVTAWIASQSHPRQANH